MLAVEVDSTGLGVVVEPSRSDVEQPAVPTMAADPMSSPPCSRERREDCLSLIMSRSYELTSRPTRHWHYMAGGETRSPTQA